MLRIFSITRLAVITGVFLSICVKDASATTQFTVNCDESNWISAPSMNTTGRLISTITSQCTIKLNSSGSISSLNTHLLAKTEKENSVHSGPTSEVYKNLPSTYFDVTKHSIQDGNKTTTRSNFHIATNQTAQLIFFDQAVEISAGGTAAFLKEWSDEQTINSSATDPTTFVFTEVQSVEIEKPWYAPEGIFVSKATKSIKSHFDTDTRVASEIIAQELLDSTSSL